MGTNHKTLKFLGSSRWFQGRFASQVGRQVGFGNQETRDDTMPWMTPDVDQVFEALSILEFHFKGRKRTTCFSRIDSHKFHYLVCYVYQHIDVDVLFVVVYVCPCCCFCFFF